MSNTVNPISVDYIMRQVNGLVAHSTDLSIEVHGITIDSRKIKDGYLFTAVQGDAVDGRKFIEDAIDRGAVVLLTDHQTAQSYSKKICCISHDEPRRAYAHIVRCLFPLQPEKMVAVTGTNGKTSVVHFYAQLLARGGFNTASIGTMGFFDGHGHSIGELTHMTTPMAEELHQRLSLLVTDYHITRAAIEASSHGLDQYRLHGITVHAAAFTNLTRDHLDYHKTLDAYFTAKLKLFSELVIPNGTAVLNQDDEHYAAIKQVCDQRGIRIWAFGKKGETCRITNIQHEGYVQCVTITYEGTRYILRLPLIGEFQVSNVLCAIGLILATEPSLSMEQLIPMAETLTGVPGRMQLLPTQQGVPSVVVDYSHTPDGLEKALEELRVVTKGKVWVVFGCGGNRDSGKRPQMGKIAAELADHIIITDDNPRHENPADIRQMILSACPNAREIADRADAIAYAVKNAHGDDMILIAGKGHETTQTIKDRVMPFNDAQVAVHAIEKYYDKHN